MRMLRDILRELTRAILGIFFRYFHQLQAQGVKNVPKSGPLVLISNHGSYYDPVIIRCLLRRRVRFMAWSKVFSWPIVGMLTRWGGAFPVDLDRPFDRNAFHQALRTLECGEAVGIFPEGGRGPGPLMGEVKLGAVQIAMRARAIIVPVSIVGAHDVWPRWRRFPQPGCIFITFHSPLPPPEENFTSWRQERTYLEGLMAQIREVINTEIASRLRSWSAQGYVGPSAERLRKMRGER